MGTSCSFFGCRCGKFVLYQKYFVTSMVCWGVMAVFGVRGSMLMIMSHVIDIIDTRVKRNASDDERCPPPKMSMNMTAISMPDVYLSWTIDDRQFVLTTFYVGYFLGHIPSGYICDLYGAKHVFTLSILCAALMNIATPYVLINEPYYIFAVVLFVMGFVQGMTLPAIMAMLAYWLTDNDVSYMVPFGYSGSCLGTALNSILFQYFTEADRDWRALFTFWAVFAGVWYLISLIFLYSSPTTHPGVSQKEAERLDEDVELIFPKQIPYLTILRDGATWAVIAGQTGHNILLAMIDANIATFLTHVIGFDLRANPLPLMLPYAVQWVFIIGWGVLAGFLINKRKTPVVYIRGILAILGNILPSACFLVATYSNCDSVIIIVWCTAAMISKAAIYAGLKANILDLTRHFAGTVGALENGLPCLSALGASQLVYYMCANHTLYEWRRLFWITFWICTFFTLTFLMWSKGKRSKYDRNIRGS